MLFDGEGFILQVQRVFTRIRSGGCGGGYWRWCVWIYDYRRGGSMHWRRPLSEIRFEWLQIQGVKNPKGFGFYL
jgi:hypothetical protein